MKSLHQSCEDTTHMIIIKLCESQPWLFAVSAIPPPRGFWSIYEDRSRESSGCGILILTLAFFISNCLEY